MFKFLSKLFGKKEQPVEVKQKRKYVRVAPPREFPNVEKEHPIKPCLKCGRITVIKKHNVEKKEDGTLFYTFTITCPKCGKSVNGYANSLQEAKLDAILQWNKEEVKEIKEVKQLKPKNKHKRKNKRK